MADAHDGTANFSLVFCSGQTNHGGLTPNSTKPLGMEAEGSETIGRFKNQHYREGRQKWEVLYQPQGSSAPSLAARKGIAGHYGVGQPNQALFSFRQSFSRGRGKGRRVAPSSAARESRQGRDWVKSKHRGAGGVIPLPSFQPTRCRVWRRMVHRDQPWRGSRRELERQLLAATTGRVRGVPLPRAQGAKSS